MENSYKYKILYYSLVILNIYNDKKFSAKLFIKDNLIYTYYDGILNYLEKYSYQTDTIEISTLFAVPKDKFAEYESYYYEYDLDRIFIEFGIKKNFENKKEQLSYLINYVICDIISQEHKLDINNVLFIRQESELYMDMYEYSSAYRKIYNMVAHDTYCEYYEEDNVNNRYFFEKNIGTYMKLEFNYGLFLTDCIITGNFDFNFNDIFVSSIIHTNDIYTQTKYTSELIFKLDSNLRNNILAIAKDGKGNI